MQMAYLNYLRNGLPSSAAGIQIDDKWSKYQPYKQNADQRIAEYKQWMTDLKPQLNAQQGWGTLGMYPLSTGW